MLNSSFSITKTFIFEPVLLLRFPLSIEGTGQLAREAIAIWNRVQSEIIARVIAVFTSLFTAIDAILHLFVGMGKGLAYVIKRSSAPSERSEVTAHFKQAFWFVKLTVIGSIAGCVWPGIFEQFHEKKAPLRQRDLSQVIANAPPQIRELAIAVAEGAEQAPFPRLRAFWNTCSQGEKDWFASVFSDDRESFKAVREELVDLVYQPIGELAPYHRSFWSLIFCGLRWLSISEVNAQVIHAGIPRIRDLWQRILGHNYPFYYHATHTVSSLQSILSSHAIEVRYESGFRGAFVSTTPETPRYGRYILALNRNIEWNSSLLHGFQHLDRFWAGFAKNIPVTDETLSCVIVDGTEEERRALEISCRQWTTRPVVRLVDAHPCIEAIRRATMGIPSYWPDRFAGQGFFSPSQLLSWRNAPWRAYCFITNEVSQFFHHLWIQYRPQ